MNYSFEIGTDPDDDEFLSIWIDNGEGCGAEIAGKIGEQKLAEIILNAVNALTQDEIKAIFFKAE